MNCQRVQDNFIDYHDGSLSGDEATRLRAHLASCLVCQREWSALKEVRAHRALTELRELYISVQKEKTA